MNFLKYIELSAENLQFFLWFRDYSKRFNELPASERALSPEWTADKSNAVTKPGPKFVNADAAAILAASNFGNEVKVDESEKGGSNPFFTPPRTPNSVERQEDSQSFDSYDDSSIGRVDHSKRADGAFESAGFKWKPCKLNHLFTYKQPLTRDSVRSALPRGGEPHHFHLHCRWRLTTAEPVFQRAHGTSACASKHHSPFRLR